MSLFSVATMGLLTARQRIFAKEMSQIVIREDHSDSDYLSISEEEGEKKETEIKFLEKVVRKMVLSKDKTD